MTLTNDVYEDSEIYVCITHRELMPCEKGDHHLVSNWISDVQKILKIMERT